MTGDEPRPPAGETAMEVPVRSWVTLGILVAIHAVHVMDRNVSLIVAELVKREFDLSDGQVGIFTGLAYSLSYGIVGVLSGPMVDRFNRSRLIAAMLFLWSGLTAIGGLATSYVQLLAARSAVGAAEAGCSPAAMSIIADLFSAGRRGVAIGLFKIGSPLGYFAASVLCGYVASSYGWRSALFVAGIPGLLLTFVVLRWVSEPRRGALDRPDRGPPGRPVPLMQVVRFMLRGPGIGFMVLGLLFFGFANSGSQAFVIPFMLRLHGLSLTEATSYFALATILGGASPVILGLINDWAMRKGTQYSLYCSAAVVLLTLVAGQVMATTETGWLLVASLVVWQVSWLGMVAMNFATILTVTPTAMRGTVVAILLSSSMVSAGIAPVVTGLLSDWFGGEASLRSAIVVMMSLNGAAICAYLASGWYLAREPVAK